MAIGQFKAQTGGGRRLSVRAVKPAGETFIGAKRRGLTEDVRDDRFRTKVPQRVGAHRLPAHHQESVFGALRKSARGAGRTKSRSRKKAPLDWVYLQRQEGLPVALDELSLNPIDKKKLQKYALQYPNSVQRTVRECRER